jgi:propane monooxygenase small subunit
MRQASFRQASSSLRCASLIGGQPNSLGGIFTVRQKPPFMRDQLMASVSDFNSKRGFMVRSEQDITLYLSEIALDLPGFDFAAGKQHWLEDPIWQGVRKSIESIMGSNDYLEQYFATNVVFESLLGELFRSGFLMQAAAAQNDFITPSVVSAAEADYERNLANTVELFHILGTDPTYGAQNVALFNKWLVKHADLALDAANQLQPIWSQPHVKVATFGDALGHAKNRIKVIAAELSLKVPANLAS